MEGYHVMKTHPQLHHASPTMYDSMYAAPRPEGLEAQAGGPKLADLSLSLQENIDAQIVSMERLSEEDREVIELRHHGGMSFKQMAETLGAPLGTLLARHHRALHKLRKMFNRVLECERRYSRKLRIDGTELT